MKRIKESESIFDKSIPGTVSNLIYEMERNHHYHNNGGNENGLHSIYSGNYDNTFGKLNDEPDYVKRIINTIPHPIAVYNKRGECSFINLGFFDNWYKRNGKKNFVFYDLFDKAEARRQKNIDADIFRNSLKFVEFELTLPIEKNGQKTRNLLLSKVSFPEDSDTVSQIICIIRDISKIKQVFNTTMEEQKRELAFQNIKLLQSSEYSKNLLGEISSLTKYLNKEGQEALKAIELAYDFSVYDNTWKELENQFNVINDSFFKKLMSEHPNLTNLERKLCFYLRLNMSTKQIALLTFSAEKSVQMARYRLRRKMNLSNGDSLSAYLADI